MSKFPERLKELRKYENIPQKRLAQKLNLQRHNVSDYEQGRVEPDIQTIINIAKYFNVSTDYLLGITNYL